MHLIFSLASDSEDAYQFVLLNGFTKLFCSLMFSTHFELMKVFLSKASMPQIMAAFSHSFSTKYRRRALHSFLGILQTKNFTESQLLMIKNLNILKYALEDLIAVGPAPLRESYYDPLFQEICLDIISFYCNTFVDDPSILEELILSIPSLQPHWGVLLPCVTKMVTNFPHLQGMVPLNLIPMLLSLENCQEVFACVSEITERCLSLGDLEFLQHLLDSGLLSYLHSSLKSKHIRKASSAAISDLCSRVTALGQPSAQRL